VISIVTIAYKEKVGGFRREKKFLSKFRHLIKV
jgi:hypothetical protein